MREIRRGRAFARPLLLDWTAPAWVASFRSATMPHAAPRPVPHSLCAESTSVQSGNQGSEGLTEPWPGFPPTHWASQRASCTSEAAARLPTHGRLTQRVGSSFAADAQLVDGNARGAIVTGWCARPRAQDFGAGSTTAPHTKGEARSHPPSLCLTRPLGTITICMVVQIRR